MKLSKWLHLWSLTISFYISPPVLLRVVLCHCEQMDFRIFSDLSFWLLWTFLPFVMVFQLFFRFFHYSTFRIILFVCVIKFSIFTFCVISFGYFFLVLRRLQFRGVKLRSSFVYICVHIVYSILSTYYYSVATIRFCSFIWYYINHGLYACFLHMTLHQPWFVSMFPSYDIALTMVYILCFLHMILYQP